LRDRRQLANLHLEAVLRGDAPDRLAFARCGDQRQGGEANRFRASLIKWYGPEKGAAVRFAEAFEICEYGRQPKPEEIKILFPFFP